MRKIKVGKVGEKLTGAETVYQFKKNYQVHPGDGSILLFRNKKKALKHLAEMNRELNLIMAEMNEILVELYRMYRSSWFYLDGKHVLENSRIQDRIRGIEKSLDMASKNVAGGSPHHLRSFLSLCFDNGDQICSSILRHQTGRSNYYEVRLCQNMASRIKALRDRFEACAK